MSDRKVPIVKVSRAKEITHYMANNGVTWKFIVERAAWWGGFWERLIQTVKRTLKVIGRSCLRFEELNTLLVEVEGIVNARPLTYVYDDLDGINFALTPSRLINGRRRLQNTPNSSHFETVSTHESLTRRYRRQKRLLNQFTDSWRKDYLVSLRETHAVSSRRNGDPGIAVGDVVLLQNRLI